MKLSRGWGLLLALLLWVWPAVASALPQETWVVAIGNNRGDASDLALLFAERDARELADVLRNQGNVASDRVRLLIDEDADTVRRTLGSVNSTLRGRQQEGGPATALIVFYSGHADAEALHLRGTHLALEELRALQDELASLQSEAAARQRGRAEERLVVGGVGHGAFASLAENGGFADIEQHGYRERRDSVERLVDNVIADAGQQVAQPLDIEQAAGCVAPRRLDQDVVGLVRAQHIVDEVG